MIKGLYIEDDNDNIISYSKRFKLKDIELISIDTFPAKPADFWQIVLENEVDFIIIDNHLHKKCVEYTGLQVLEEIRKQDSEIYILYLTSKGIDFADKKLSNFDMEVDKNDFIEKFQIVVDRIKRATSRDLGIKMEREIQEVSRIQNKYYEDRYKLLKEKLG